jgi:hypothetical protein
MLSEYRVPEKDERWCERGDLNPHGDYPPDPKSGASANSATFAWLALQVYPTRCYSVANTGAASICSRSLWSIFINSFARDSRLPGSRGLVAASAASPEGSTGT